MNSGESVAVVGVGGEFPSSPTLDRYWDTIIHNVNTSRQPPQGRWLLNPEAVYDEQVGAADKVYSKQACFLDDEVNQRQIKGFDLDPDFVEGLDPMFRLLLRVGRQSVPAAFQEKLDGLSLIHI